MRRILVVTACLAALMAGPAVAEVDSSDPNYHELPLSIGNEGRIVQTAKVTKSRTQRGKTQTAVTESVANLDYQARDGSYAVTRTRVSFRNYSPDGSAKDLDDPSNAAINSALAGVEEMRFVADSGLRPVRIEDWPNFRSNIYALFDQFAGLSPSATIKAQSRQLAEATFGQLTAESGAELFLANETMLSLGHDKGLVLNSPVSVESKIVLPIGNAVLDARETIVLTVWDESKGTAHLSYDYAPTPESVKVFLADFLPRFVQNMQMSAEARAEMTQSLDQVIKSAVVDMSTHCDFDVAITTGLVNGSVCVRTVAFTFGDVKVRKVERYELSERLAP